MSNRTIAVSSATFLAALLSVTGCGSFFQQVHNCGNCTVPTFLFAAELNSVAGYNLSTSGALSPAGSLAGPNQSLGIVSNSGGTFLYVSDFQNAAVDAFTIDTSSGSLSAVAGSPFSAGPAPGGGGLAIDPSSKFLYVTQVYSAAVAGFTIAPGTGVLTPISGSPFPAGDTPMQALVDPSGKFLYVSNLKDAFGGISAYTIDSTTGALTAVTGSPFPTQTNSPGPNRMAIGGGGKFLYVGMSGTVSANNAISAFTIDPGSGALTQLANSPFATGNNPQGVASDPAGKFLFTANIQDNTVSAFTIDPTSGTLTAVSGSPFATSSAPLAVTTDTAGQFLFVGGSGTGGISAYSIDATTGALTPVSGSPFSTSSGVNGLAISRP